MDVMTPNSSISTPRVSVIIPNYNHARYLPQRIESVLNQTFRDLEVLLLDDCSPDDSRAVIAKYAAQDTRIRVVLNAQNSGSTFKQWNKGFALIRGEYVWVAESDDFAEPDLLEKLLVPLLADEAVVLAYCNSFDVDEYGHVSGTWESFLTELGPQWQHDFVAEGLPLVLRYLSFRNFIPNASAVLMRASALRAAGPADESYRLVGDVIFWARLLARGKMAYVAQPLNYFRTHRQNARSKNYENGTTVEEASRVPILLRAYGELDPVFVEKAIRFLLELWYNATIHFFIPWSRQRTIFRNFIVIDPRTRKLIFRTFGRKFFSKASGFRILLGDRLLYRWLKKSGK
ncbi:glycosyltransferase family 2 protein [Hymenobacter psoromatis]|uniref:glycosyltransferase family 2 protein n=1 Tax=Hymenobacter psoromatis TaxID=1484116 RepID=UPI001CC0EF1C|nr:glycosyltransferase [Hymenobacter psoromatis]